MKNKRKFTHDGVEYEVVRPDYETQKRGQFVYGRTYKEAVDAGVCVSAKLDDVMRQQNLWSDEHQQKENALRKRLNDNQLKLDKGGIRLAEAREVAIQMRRDRSELIQLLSRRNELEKNTAEAMSENARFNYYVSECTVHADTGKKVFASFDEYQSGYSNNPVAQKAAAELGSLLYDFEDSFYKELPENKFLTKYKLANEDGHLIRKDGRLVDTKGNLVNDKGQLINENDELIDENGNVLNEDGSFKVDFVPFMDDDGNPVSV